MIVALHIVLNFVLRLMARFTDSFRLCEFKLKCKRCIFTHRSIEICSYITKTYRVSHSQYLLGMLLLSRKSWILVLVH